MEISPLDNGNYYIRFSKEELSENDVTDMLCRIPNNEPAYYEIYGSDSGALVFARARDKEPACFSFDSIEKIIEAARVCPGDTLSYLAHTGGRYMLIIYPWNNEKPPLGLFEFASPTRAHPDITYHFEEQGEILLGPEAVRDIQVIFR